MRYKLTVVAVLSAFLAACGGGGGISSTPTPAPAPSPTPTNTTMNDLRANQTFASDAGANAVSFDLTAQTVASASKAPGDLIIHYDAAAQSYTVTFGGTSETFLPSNVSATTSSDTQYALSTATGHDYLTLVKVPYSGNPAGQYVRMGYLQRNVITGSTQDTDFATFTYGLDTPVGSVPRTGSAGYKVDIFGLASTPGHEPRIFQGPGTFATDFASGVFSMQSSSLTDYDLLTGGGVYGGSVFLNASGHLSASDGTLSGLVAFDGQYGKIPGTLS
ncbi:MAG: hypothetical protein J2O44_06000, partial [Porphyrobacter sp.]|nr:hypothetical protein [Porphyrobacter sp.]